jgi:mRNA deadenylase 3'-5' endonuclease subunit Ccr4
MLGGCSFSVLQWNVLAAWLCDAKAFPHAHDVKSLDWEVRANAFKKILVESPVFDFVSLQEVDHWSDFFEPEFSKLGFQGHFFKKQADDILFSYSTIRASAPS